MAHSPTHADVVTPEGVARVALRYLRPFIQVVRVRTCWLFDAQVEHSCDAEQCWGS